MSTSATPRSFLLLLLLIVAGCLGYKPLINPNRPELIINEGEPLEFTCTSNDEINVYYPENDIMFGIVTSEHHLIPENENDESVKQTFRREKSVFGDTGWYGCADVKATIVNKDYNDPNASWIYVYVRSNESALVATREMAQTIGALGGNAIIPCRPTSPELHVNISKLLQLNGPDDRFSFDPKIGYTLRDLTVKDNGPYKCTIKQDAFDETINFYLKVIRESRMIVEIPKEGLEYVTAGSSLHVKCKVTLPADNDYSLIWEKPNNSDSIRILPQVKEKKANHMVTVTSELVNDNVTFDDEGQYVCEVSSYNGSSNRTSRYIHVHDPNRHFIILTSHDKIRKYTLNARQSVIFSAYYMGHPKPMLTWFNPQSQAMQNSNSVSIETTSSSSILKISSVDLKDIGTFVLEANNGAVIQRLNFTLNVLSGPLILIIPDKLYYAMNELGTFTCEFLGNPEPDVIWLYTKCQNVTSMEGCETVKYQSEKITVTDESKQWRAMVKIKVEMSGKVQCKATNVYGSDSSEMDVFISDGLTNASFGVIEPANPVVKGEELALVCAASVYNFTSVEWLTNNFLPLNTSERVAVTFKTTNFTHRATLRIKAVLDQDAGEYVCKVTDHDNQPDYAQFKLVVNKPIGPTFTNVNMNNSKMEVSTEETQKSIHFYCFAEGMPKPRVTWYKDDQPLILKDKQFTLQQDDQELVIMYLMVKDSGKYSCVVKNSFGRLDRFTEILVKGARVSIAWIAVIAVLILVLVILLIYFCIRVRREQNLRKQLLKAGLMHFEEGALDCINPELTVDDQADLLPYDRKWEFPRDKLKLGKQLGSGAFGVVMKAQARGIRASESETTVAVKMVRKNAEPAYIGALASELKIMVHLGKHLNVVNLLGACTNNIAKRELLVIVEYCHYGNLHNYLLRHRNSFIDQIDLETGRIDPSVGRDLLMRTTSIGSNSINSASDYGTNPGTETVIYCTDTQDITGLPDITCQNSDDSQPGWRSNYRGDYKDRNLKPICTQDLLSWAFQVARGMEYLCQRKVLHGDLAARNILLAENNVVKICDFGLAKTMYKDDNYKKKGNGPVPIKWMAIESIRDHVFSTQSDIWSFGIVLWEFFTLAETPYPGMKAETQYQRLIEGYRMDKPKYATEDIYGIMTKCWKAKPTLRPSFTELVESIGDLLEEGVKQHYVELNTPFFEMNTSEGKNDYLTMMTAPDHSIIAGPQHDYINSPSVPADSAYLSMNSPVGEPGIFSPRPSSTQENSRFQFASTPTSGGATTHSDNEDTPMLKRGDPVPVEEEDDDNYLKPINVSKKREEFIRQREAEKRKEEQRDSSSSTFADRDSGYCNTPKGLELLDMRAEAARNREHDWSNSAGTDRSPAIIRTQDNYVNMPKQKNELRGRDQPDSYMNPSYVFVESSKSEEETL